MRVIEWADRKLPGCAGFYWRGTRREGLLKTPEGGKGHALSHTSYNLDAKAIINSAKFHEPVSEMIVVKDIEIYSMCEHPCCHLSGKHMWPIFPMAGLRASAK